MVSPMWPCKTRVYAFLVVGGRSEVVRAGHVGGAAVVLAAAVAQEERIRSHLSRALRAGAVVDDGAVGSLAGDRSEDSSLNPGCSARNLETHSPISYSSHSLPCAACSSSQHQKDAIATPSRRCASSMPASSASFFTALANGIRRRPP